MIKYNRKITIIINNMSGQRETLSQTWLSIQISLFPWLSEELGSLNKKQQDLVKILELISIEEFIYLIIVFPGCPRNDSTAIARAFVAKMVYHLPTTRALLDRFDKDRLAWMHLTRQA